MLTLYLKVFFSTGMSTQRRGSLQYCFFRVQFPETMMVTGHRHFYLRSIRANVKLPRRKCEVGGKGGARGRAGCAFLVQELSIKASPFPCTSMLSQTSSQPSIFDNIKRSLRPLARILLTANFPASHLRMVWSKRQVLFCVSLASGKKGRSPEQHREHVGATDCVSFLSAACLTDKDIGAVREKQSTGL